MDKELVEYFINEMIEDKEWHDRWKANHIEFDNYFKYSGKIEEDSPSYQFESQNVTKYSDKLYEIKIKDKENENINTI